MSESEGARHHSNQDKPKLEDIGHELVVSTLPHIPDAVTGQGGFREFLPMFEGHPEAEKLAKIYATRVAVKEVPTPDGPVQIGLARKNHPYMLISPYDTMIQYWGNEPIMTVAEWQNERYPVGVEYFKMVAETAEAVMDMSKNEKARYVISTNSAPYGRFLDRSRVIQSLAAPHTHVLAFTEAEVEGAMKFMTEYKSRAEGRRYGGLNSEVNEMYRQIVWSLFAGRTRDEHDVNFDEIGEDKFGPMKLDNAKISLHERSPETMPPGFSFEMKNGPKDMADPDFFNRVILWDDALRKTYDELAAIFIRNYDDIPQIGDNAEQSVPLELRSYEDQMLQLKAFLARHNGRGTERISPDLAHKMESFVKHMNGMMRTPEAREKGGDFLTKYFTRGHAYSIVAHPVDWENPHGAWKVKIPLWLHGGGGVEALGIDKDRLKETDPVTGQPNQLNAEYLAKYMEHQPERDAFNREIARRLHAMDPAVEAVAK